MPIKELKPEWTVGIDWIKRVNDLFLTADNLILKLNQGYDVVQDTIAILKLILDVVGYYIAQEKTDLLKILKNVEDGIIEKDNKKIQLSFKARRELLNFVYSRMHDILYENEFFIRLQRMVSKEDIKKYYTK
ncbi:MAG: hypothetical protein QW633_03795 [Candidatus Aenigmatarchaeota archaeon]